METWVVNIYFSYKKGAHYLWIKSRLSEKHTYCVHCVVDSINLSTQGFEIMFKYYPEYCWIGLSPLKFNRGKKSQLQLSVLGKLSCTANVVFILTAVNHNWLPCLTLEKLKGKVSTLTWLKRQSSMNFIYHFSSGSVMLLFVLFGWLLGWFLRQGLTLAQLPSMHSPPGSAGPTCSATSHSHLLPTSTYWHSISFCIYLQNKANTDTCVFLYILLLNKW